MQGNFIFDDEGIIAKVIGFKPYEHSVRCDEEEGCEILIDLYPQDGKVRKGYAIESTSVNPIPITPEWLERCGYKKDSTDKKWYKSPHNLPPIYQWRPGSFGMDGLPLAAKSIEYVHQLQRLYFALTGEELKIEL